MKPLNTQQQELVETNHNLIYKFAIKNNLPLDEYYDLLAIGMCEAAQIFDESKGKFSTVAFCCMANRVKNYWRHLSIKSIVPNEMTIYYDAPNKNTHDNSDKSLSVLDCLVSDNCTHDVAINNVVISTLLDLLTGVEKTIVQLIMSGMTQVEVAKYMKCSRQNISGRIRSIRKKYLAYMNY